MCAAIGCGLTRAKKTREKECDCFQGRRLEEKRKGGQKKKKDENHKTHKKG
jgi:hypothetical protein